MMEKIRFHLDENIHPEIAAGLRHYGIDVTTAAGVGLLGATDIEQLNYAREEQRVLVTHDDDFLVLNDAGQSHTGIAYCHPKKRKIGRMLRALVFLWNNTSVENMRDCISYL